ncbi:hypothetical protein [Streptomyces roseolus]|uniref:hypothetical protein n=1 Tax=Streptomyces roseolus TaxID=67358 RepID=UPI00199726C5|nr:hypothetical protein [Streptomyces roseolus]GGR28036.1 hypothetical protein GCM10010282_20460 [Streptomyces roseolus]
MRRGVWCAPPCAVLSAASPLASAAAPPAPGEAARARLHRGADPRVGEQKSPKDNGRVLIAEPGDRETAGDYPAARTRRQESASINDSTHSADDWPNSGSTEFGKAGTARFPAVGNTPGYDSDVFDLRGAPRNGADRVHVRLGSREDTVWPGALFPRADVRR